MTASPSATATAVPKNAAPLRILLLTDAYLPHAGGARVYYDCLYRVLAESGQSEITILTKKVPGWEEYDRVESRKGYRIIRCGTPLQSWKYQELPKIAIPLLRAAALLATERFDLIHFGDLYPQGVISLLFKRILGRSYVAYSHGEEITSIDGRRYQPKVRDAIFGQAAMVVAANEFARQNLLRIGIPDGRIRKITPGVDCARFQPEAPRRELVERYGLQGKKVLLTVGRLVPRKGHRTVLEAMRQILPKFPDLAYVIVGTGPEQDELKRLVAEWNLTGAVHFAGYVAEADLPAYYNLCDLFVLPNSDDRGDVEGFGMVFLEANACGKPVIAGRSGGTAEAVIDGATGFLVEPEKAAELADVLQSLLPNPSIRNKLGERGLLRARAEFSWESRARMLDAMNRELIAGIRRSAASPETR